MDTRPTTRPQPDTPTCSRRDILRSAAAFAGTVAAAYLTTHIDAVATSTGDIPRRALGATGAQVSILGVGGAHFIRQSTEEGVRLVHEALDEGVNFFDNAWEYNRTRSESVMGTALKGKRDRAFLMTKVCTHGRNKAVAMRQLEQSLRRLQTDYLDLWQIHEVNCADDPASLFTRDAVTEALLEAQRQGKVRFIGMTGHKDPTVFTRVLAQGFPFETCQLPLNPFDASFDSFERLVLPELQRQRIAPIAMKTLCGRGEPVTRGILTVEEGLRYAWSLPVATVVSGMDRREHLRHNIACARRFTPYTADEMQALRARVASHADGRFEYYKTGPSRHCDRTAAVEFLETLDAETDKP
ncbi:MAG: aldo/keto reductase [Nitrospiraceae bacterium]